MYLPSISVSHKSRSFSFWSSWIFLFSLLSGIVRALPMDGNPPLVLRSAQGRDAPQNSDDPRCKLDKTYIDLNDAPIKTCTMQEENGSPVLKSFDWSFYWCNPTPDTDPCPGAYAAQTETTAKGKRCDRNLNSWGDGLKLTPDGNGIMYDLYDKDRNHALITIQCDKTVDDIQCPDKYKAKVSFFGGVPIEYQINLISSWGCPDVKHPKKGGGDGDGSFPKGAIFLIVFFVGFFLYFSIGFAINYKHNELRGVEAIPQVEHWKEVPVLVKEGCVFTWEGCKATWARVRGQEYQPV